MHDGGAEPGQGVKSKLALGANPALIGCALCLQARSQSPAEPCPDFHYGGPKTAFSLLSSWFAVKVAGKTGTINTGREPVANMPGFRETESRRRGGGTLVPRHRRKAIRSAPNA
jgi:hypothetical protein